MTFKYISWTKHLANQGIPANRDDIDMGSDRSESNETASQDPENGPSLQECVEGPRIGLAVLSTGLGRTSAANQYRRTCPAHLARKEALDPADSWTLVASKASVQASKAVSGKVGKVSYADTARREGPE